MQSVVIRRDKGQNGGECRFMMTAMRPSKPFPRRDDG